MNELSPRARALIESAMAHEEGPSAAELGRVRRSVLSGLAASGAVAAASTTFFAKAAAALASTAGQVTAYAAAGALAAGATLAVHQTVVREPSPSPMVASIEHAPGAVDLRDRAGAVSAPSSPTPPPEAATVIADSSRTVAAPDVVATSLEQPSVPSPRLAQPTVGSTGAPPRAGAPELVNPITAAPSTPSALGPRAAFASPSSDLESAPGGAALTRPSGDLARQLAYLHAMRTELHAGNAGRALELSRESEALFPGSGLEAEARAARIAALCRLGQSAEARGAIERFRQLFPKSALLRNVEHGCTIDLREGTGH
jgi:hypothetical protein